MAVIASPCSADVLVTAPEIRRYFESINEGHERTRLSRINEALNELGERGLLFRVEPHPRMKDRHDALTKDNNDRKDEKRNRKLDIIFGSLQPEEMCRYALHRLMQRHIIRKMGIGPRDMSQINSFAPSLLASMPGVLPSLTHEAYMFLKTLVASYSQYPDHENLIPGPENWHLSKTPISTQVQALRSALSVVRSTFSVAVVSRFEDYSLMDQKKTNLTQGYFEEYRIQLRWLIRKAYELLEEELPNLRAYRASKEEFSHINAFYIDEIIWLYNECGAVNLVQGNLTDAVALIRQGIRFNRKVEGTLDGGAHHNRLSLNLAIAQIERGRIESARQRLLEICNSEERNGLRKGRLWHIAYGYTALICHLSGDREEAERRYNSSLKILRIYEDTRSCAIFYRHLGDLRRSVNDFPGAETALNEALAFSEAGGHEDIHKRVRLSIIKFDIACAIKKDENPNVKKLNAELKVVGDYANTMEMPSLRCDVDHVRAQIMMHDGETSMAGQLLSRNITIAKRNDMNLRLNASLTQYARVLSLRGLRDQANKLLFTSLEMAKRNKCQFEINAVEKVFEELHKI